MSLNMVDLSNHNSAVNFDQLRRENVEVVFAKATELQTDGSVFQDQDYEANRRGAAAIGATFGAYMFAHASTDPARSFAAFAHYADLRPGDLWALDIGEELALDGIEPAKAAPWAAKVSHAGWGLYGAWPWGYSNLSSLPALDDMRHCPLWLADPGDPTYPQNVAGFPVVTAKQYAIIGGIDRSVAYVSSRAQLAKLAVQPHLSHPQILARQVREHIGAAAGLLHQAAGEITPLC